MHCTAGDGRLWLAGQRRVLALEAHIRNTPDLLARALRQGLPVFDREAAAGRPPDGRLPGRSRPVTPA